MKRTEVRLGYCFTPYQRLWLYNGAALVAFYDTLGIRRTYSRLKPPASSRGWNELRQKPNPTWAVKNDRWWCCWISCITSQTTIFQLLAHVTAHSCAGGLKKKLDLWSDSHAIDSLTRPSKHPFYGHSGKPDTSFTQWDPSVVNLRLRSNPLSNKHRSQIPILTRIGIRRTYSSNPGPHGLGNTIQTN